MRFLIPLAVIAVAACAGKPPQEAPAERKVQVNSSNIVEVQKAGYKIVTKDGQKLYCKRDLNTGSHLRYTTSCLTEQEWTAMSDAARRGVETMRRTQAPMQGR